MRNGQIVQFRQSYKGRNALNYVDDDLSEALGSQDVPESGGRQKVSWVPVIFHVVRRHRRVAHLRQAFLLSLMSQHCEPL